MKKLIKACFIVGACCVLVGGGLALGALAMGANPNSTRLPFLARSPYGYASGVLTRMAEVTENIHDDFSGSHESGIKSTVASDSRITQYQGVKKLDLEIGTGKVFISEWKEDQVGIQWEGEPKDLTATMDKDKLKIRTEALVYHSNKPFWNREEESRFVNRVLNIYLPKDYTFDSVDIKLGVGKVTAAKLWAREMELEVKAGEILVQDGQAGKLEADCTTGGIQYDGKVDGNLDADCSVGAIHLNLTGKQADYDYQLECRVGSISIGKDSYTGIKGKRTIDNRAGKKMELECSTGVIEVEFNAPK